MYVYLVVEKSQNQCGSTFNQPQLLTVVFVIMLCKGKKPGN